MTQKRDLLINNSAADSLLTVGKQIFSDHDENVVVAEASAGVAYAIGYPFAYNKSVAKFAPWMAPDATVSVITLTGATGGTFTITVNSATTAALAYNATIAVVAAALKAIGYDVTVALDTLIYTLTFDGTPEIETLPTVTADTSLITGDVSESVTVNDGTAQFASPTVLNISLGITVPATGGTFTVTYDGNTSAGIAFDASAADIQTAVLAIGTHAPDTVTVTRPGLSDISIAFDDEDDLLTLPTVSASLASITGATGEQALATAGDVLSLSTASDVEIDVGTATGGTFTVTVNGLTTAGIAFDAAVGAVDSALTAIGFDVSTALASTTYTITFSDKVEVITLPTITASIAGLTGAVVAIVTTAGNATNGTQEIRGFVNPNVIQSGITAGDAAFVVLTGTDTLCTATTVNPHGLVTGMEIDVTGATESNINVTDEAITVLTAFTYTFAVTAVTGGTVDSGAYTTTNDTMGTIMTKGKIHAAVPEALVASGDVAALRVALKDDLMAKSLIIQGLTGTF